MQILRIMLVSYSTSTACNQLGSILTCMWTSFDPFSSFYDFYLYLFIAYIVLSGSLAVLVNNSLEQRNCTFYSSLFKYVCSVELFKLRFS